jgi:hypothetical protein
MQTPSYFSFARAAVAIGLCALVHALPAAAQGTGGSVANATLTSGIDDGAPVDFRQAFDTNTPAVYYYTEILGLHGQTVTHRWKLEGKVMQEVPIAVKRSRQAVWSKSAMQPDWTGSWTVEVVTERGEVIETDNFAYSPPM